MLRQVHRVVEDTKNDDEVGQRQTIEDEVAWPPDRRTVGIAPDMTEMEMEEVGCDDADLPSAGRRVRLKDCFQASIDQVLVTAAAGQAEMLAAPFEDRRDILLRLAGQPLFHFGPERLVSRLASQSLIWSSSRSI